MNCKEIVQDESVQAMYFSSVLAKALQESDGDKFTEVYDLLCQEISDKEIEFIKEKARDMANLPSELLLQKISVLKNKGAKPLQLTSGYVTEPKIVENNIDYRNADAEHSFFHDKEALSYEKQSVVVKNSVTIENTSFESLNRNERSLVELQNRANKFSNKNNLVKPIDKFVQSSKMQDHIIVVPMPSAGENAQFQISETTEIKSPQADIPLNYVNKEKLNGAGNKSSWSACKDANKDDISTCVNFSLSKSATPSGSTLDQHSFSMSKPENLNHKNPPSSVLEKDAGTILTVENGRKTNEGKDSAGFTSKSSAFQNINSSSNCLIHRDDKTSKFRSIVDNDAILKPKDDFKKPKRRTIKDYKRERLNQIAAGENGKLAVCCPALTMSSKTAQRKLNEKHKLEMLPDVKVNEILMKCGEPCNVLENSKLELQKKSKKKIRKPKKPAGKSENSEIVVPLKVDPQNSHNLRTMAGGDAATVEENRIVKEFIVKKRKSLLSQSQLQSASRTNEKRVDAGINIDLKNKFQLSNLAASSFSCDASSLPKSAAAVCPVKFKIVVLDSAGCSVASSSEDGSSTSSNIYSPSAPELPNLGTVSHDDEITNMTEAKTTSARNVSPQISVSRNDDYASHSKPDKNTPNTMSYKQSRSKNVVAPQQNKVSTEKSVKEEKAKFQRCLLSKSSCTEKVMDHHVLPELKNRWGLDFFYEENSSLNSGNHLEQLNLTQSDTRLSFDVGNVGFSLAKSDLNVREKPDETFSNLTCQSERSTSSKHNINIENFNMEEALAVLFQEWKHALRHGQFYKDT